MKWLKYELCYAEGYGDPEYIYVGNASDDAILEILWSARNEQMDNIREPKWSVIDKPPVKVIEDKIENTQLVIRSNQAYLELLKRLLLT